jgi:hypothetical protein
MRNPIMNKQTRFQIPTLLTFGALFGLALASCKSSDAIGKADEQHDAATERGADGAPDLGPDLGADLGADGAPDLPIDRPSDLAMGPDLAPDQGPGIDLSVDLSSGCLDSTESHVGSDGQAWWWWRFHWQNTSACAAWGSDAKVIVEVDAPSNPSDASGGLRICSLDELSSDNGSPCAMANTWRFQASCTAGELLLDLPSNNLFHGYYHVESSTFPSSARHLINQDVHCSRDLYLPTGLGSAPVLPDGGVDGSDATCAAPKASVDAGAGCGPDEAWITSTIGIFNAFCGKLCRNTSECPTGMTCVFNTSAPDNPDPVCVSDQVPTPRCGTSHPLLDGPNSICRDSNTVGVKYVNDRTGIAGWALSACPNGCNPTGPDAGTPGFIAGSCR